MSAPNTNIEKQERQHAVPLGGMASVLIFAAVLLLGLIIWTFYVGGATPAEVDAAAPNATAAEVDNGVTPAPAD